MSTITCESNDKKSLKIPWIQLMIRITIKIEVYVRCALVEIS